MPKKVIPAAIVFDLKLLYLNKSKIEALLSSELSIYNYSTYSISISSLPFLFAIVFKTFKVSSLFLLRRNFGDYTR